MMRQTISKNRTFVKKGAWSPEEDEKLIAYITRYGIWNWNETPKFAGLSRSGKSCRLRWMNYLRPNIKLGNFTREEEETIVNMQKMLGNRWSVIAAVLPQRTDNDIKNCWNTRLKKRANNLASASASATQNNSCIKTEQESCSDADSSFLNTFLELDFPEPASPSQSTITVENNFVSSQESWEIKSLLEDFEAMSPKSQLWAHEPIFLNESYFNPADDFWVNPFI